MFSAKIWREFPQRYRLEAAKCKKCGQVFFPPRLICNTCHHREFETISLPWEGTLVSFTIIRTPPSTFADEAPYAVGMIEVMKGLRLTCQIVDVDFDKLKVGQKLLLEFRLVQRDGHSGLLCYGYKAVPIGEHNSI